MTTQVMVSTGKLTDVATHQLGLFRHIPICPGLESEGRGKKHCNHCVDGSRPVGGYTT